MSKIDEVLLQLKDTSYGTTHKCDGELLAERLLKVSGGVAENDNGEVSLILNINDHAFAGTPEQFASFLLSVAEFVQIVGPKLK